MTEELIEIQSRVSSALHSRLGRRRSEGARGAEGKAVSRDHRSPSLDITERRMDSQSDPSQHSLESSETSRKANTKETSRSWKWSRVKRLISLQAIRALNARMFRGWKRLPTWAIPPSIPWQILRRDKDAGKGRFETLCLRHELSTSQRSVSMEDQWRSDTCCELSSKTFQIDETSNRESVSRFSEHWDSID